MYINGKKVLNNRASARQRHSGYSYGGKHPFDVINSYMARAGDTVTRQVNRCLSRLQKAAVAADASEAACEEARRALLERQSRREKSGFYNGHTSVATALGAVGRLRRFKEDGRLVRLR